MTALRRLLVPPAADPFEVDNDPAKRMPGTVAEDLGTQSISGVQAQGARFSRTIPAGSIGNNRDIKVVNELWLSSDIEAVVRSTSTDQRFGTTTFELTRIVRGPQDPALFQVPPDYAILDGDPTSPAAHLQTAQAMFREGRYQEAANEFRNALRGDQPTVVWAHISLGKIFDLTGERDRAVSQYQPALETNDDTNGALAEASRYLKTPYKPGD